MWQPPITKNPTSLASVVKAFCTNQKGSSGLLSSTEFNTTNHADVSYLNSLPQELTASKTIGADCNTDPGRHFPPPYLFNGGECIGLCQSQAISYENESTNIASRARYYPVPRVPPLCAPYQTFPIVGSPVFIYSWTLPKSDTLAKLAAVEPSCFNNTDQAIGLLFSKPISRKDYVCRIPIYLTRGMARARIHLVNTVLLNSNEMDQIQQAHQALSGLIHDNAHISNFGHKSLNPLLRDLCANQDSAFSASNNEFKELQYNPNAAHILSLITILKLPSYDIDFDALRTLITWTVSQSTKDGSNEDKLTPVVPTRGILPRWLVTLGCISVSHWVGRIVRPIHLPDDDPGIFAVSNVNSETGQSYIPKEQSDKIIRASNGLTYADYFLTRYPVIQQISASIDRNLPLFTSLRLTRHRNSAQVSAGLRNKTLSNSKPLKFLPDICLVHPLSAWLWFLASVTPVIIYQVSRALLMAHWSIALTKELTSSKLFPFHCSADQSGAVFLSCVTVLLPDRLQSEFCLQNKSNPLDSEVDEETSITDKKMDIEAERLDVPLVCPPVSKLIEPTTLASANDSVNLERLEFLGDSLLHYITTLYVFGYNTQDTDQGVLTSKRSVLVSNAHLCDLITTLQWYNYCTSRSFSPSDHFLPPCYTVVPKNGAYDSRLFVKLYDKALADMLEALLGSFLLHSGLPTACNLLHYLKLCPVTWDTLSTDEHFRASAPWYRFLHSGISTMPDFSQLSVGAISSSRPVNWQMKCTKEICNLTAMTKNVRLHSTPEHLSSMCMRILENCLSPLQVILNYNFVNIGHLAEALTYRGSFYSKIWGNYDRLEFLGDSVLGHVVSVCFYQRCPHFDPGKLSNARSSVVSNSSLASAIVEHGIHPFINYEQDSLDEAVAEILEIHQQTKCPMKRLELLNLKVVQKQIKILADIFESILGAVFVDSCGDYQLVSTKVHMLLGKHIDVVKKEQMNLL